MIIGSHSLSPVCITAMAAMLGLQSSAKLAHYQWNGALSLVKC